MRRFRGAAWRTTTIAGLVVLPALLIVILPADDGRATTVDWANRSSTWAPVTASRYPGAGDLDGDGDADLIVFDPIGALDNTGPGSYPSWSARDDWVATLVLPEGYIFGADLGDLDADGDSDLLVSILFYLFHGCQSFVHLLSNECKNFNDNFLYIRCNLV